MTHLEIGKILETVKIWWANGGFSSDREMCLKKIKELVEKRTLGKIISVQTECSSYLPDWHPYEDYRKGYAAREDLGGGAVLTQIHEIDYMYWFFQEVENIVSISGKFSDKFSST